MLDWTQSLIALSVILLSMGGEEVIRRLGEEQRCGRRCLSRVRSGLRD